MSTQDCHGLDSNWSGTHGSSAEYGMTFTASGSVTLTQATKDSNCDATVCTLQLSGGEFVASGAFSGDTVSFNQSLTDGQDYFIVCSNHGSNYDSKYNSPYTYPVAGVNVSWRGAVQEGSVTAAGFNITCVTTEAAAAGTNFQINKDDAWKEVSAITVNKDDAWKSVSAATVNKDDAWKSIF